MAHQPEIIRLPAFRLAGKTMKMTFADHRPAELWKQLMPQLKHLNGIEAMPLYSCEVYPEGFLQNFNPHAEFDKWAAVRLKENAALPESLDELPVPEGLWAIFTFTGTKADTAGFYRYIYNEWLPGSGYVTDERPHMALMDERYRNNDPASQEDILIPLRLP